MKKILYTEVNNLMKSTKPILVGNKLIDVTINKQFVINLIDLDTNKVIYTKHCVSFITAKRYVRKQLKYIKGEI